jgi:predicted phosphodiesterase
MRYLVLSDIHANYDALDVVLRRVRRKRFDAVLMLGDVVGYGAAPNQVVEALRGLKTPMVRIRGNHDKVASGVEDGASFNHVALEAAEWTRDKLTPANLRWVHELPRGPVAVADGLSICHGSPLDEDTYVFSDFEAFQIFAAHEPQVTFFGHTHITSVFVEAPDGLQVAPLRGEEGSFEIEDGSRYLINPGSIGQPRDRDPRASFMTYDTDKRLVRWYRLEYPVYQAQERILGAGLPGVLAERLAVGA